MICSSLCRVPFTVVLSGPVFRDYVSAKWITFIIRELTPLCSLFIMHRWRAEVADRNAGELPLQPACSEQRAKVLPLLFHCRRETCWRCRRRAVCEIIVKYHACRIVGSG